MPGIPVWLKETADRDYPLYTDIFENTSTQLILKNSKLSCFSDKCDAVILFPS